MSLMNALKGISGEYEVNRIVGAFGASAYVIGAHAFVAWSMHRGEHFDLIAYCAAFPAGLGVAVGSIAGAVSLKDRNVATAKVVAETGALPAAANQNTPQPVIVKQPPDEPIPVEATGA